VSGAIPVASVPAGSPNYIQNTTTQQANSNFAISGNGVAAGTLAGNEVSAATQYNLGGQRVLSVNTDSLFVGINVNNATTNSHNSFFGVNSGQLNALGGGNSFFGAYTGQNNYAGGGNSFFGAYAGRNNKLGELNSFFGLQAGENSDADTNSFFGSIAGLNNTTGGGNCFFGHAAGSSNTTGDENVFIGLAAGSHNTTGTKNIFVGASAGYLNTTASNNTFIGYLSNFDSDTPTGNNNTLLGYQAIVKSGVRSATAIGARAQATTSHTVVLGSDQEVVIVPGKLEVDTLGTSGNQPLCLNSAKRIAACGSSLRYKTDLRPFAAGLSIINRLQPVSFTWKEGGLRDFGLGAEEVYRIEPLLVTYNTQGLVEGVKYDRVAVVLVNAIKEQQALIKLQQSHFEQQQAQLEQQRTEIAELKKLLCLEHQNAGFCK